jgi:hypothetical protein
MTFTVSDRLWRPRETVDSAVRDQPANPALPRVARLTDASIGESLFQFSLVLIGEKNAFLSSDAKFF